MICYTLSDCVLKNINTDPRKKEIKSDLLGVFPQSNNPHKVVIDRDGKIIDIYDSIAEEAGVFYWLQIMGDFPSSWEPVDIDGIGELTKNEDIFMKVCSQTADRLLITYNHNGWTKDLYCLNRYVQYDNLILRVLDREEAMKILSLTESDALEIVSEIKKESQGIVINNISNSIVAFGDSKIENAKIKRK
jgi:hypothetical protein